MQFKITMQYAQGAETTCADLTHIKSIKDAEIAIQEKLQANAAMGVKATYRLYEWDDLIKEFDPNTVNTSIEDANSNASGKGSGANFRPTPFNPAPRPSGLPQNWIKDEDEDKKK